MNRRIQVSVALIAVGVGLLLVTTGQVSVGRLIAPLVSVLLGIGLLVRGFMPDGREGLAFSGTALALTGGFWLLWVSALPGLQLATVWPAFMTIGGSAIIVYGIRRGQGEGGSSSLVIPGIAIVVLSLLFLLISLGVIQAGLGSLAVRWWPVLLVALGLSILFGRSDS